MKTCSKCGPTEGPFYDQNQSTCKACLKIYKAQYYLTNKAKMNAQNSASYEANKERYSEERKVKYLANPDPAKARAKKRREAKPDEISEWHKTHYQETRQSRLDALLLKKFGLTRVQYNEKLASQGGACAICGDPPGKKSLAVDHDHATGQIRSLLCTRCNIGLGQFCDRVDLLCLAVKYLESHRKER
jgi:hypothetical protein